jgi:hypothetical protein
MTNKKYNTIGYLAFWVIAGCGTSESASVGTIICQLGGTALN